MRAGGCCCRAAAAVPDSQQHHARFFKDAVGCIIICSVDIKDSFDKAKTWIDSVSQLAKQNEGGDKKSIQIILAANKVDLAAESVEVPDWKVRKHFLPPPPLCPATPLLSAPARAGYCLTRVDSPAAQERGQELAKDIAAELGQEVPFFGTSAKSGDNVEELFQKMAELIRDSKVCSCAWSDTPERRAATACPSQCSSQCS